ncbi:hypothetical protein DLAC_09033 [Tieghemostelium lacteum]|uniref:Kelch repeat-containing protein n=1 Tax=Tieghemostelium lacteum TaxID=361077 RepID=A0A151Z981_TIELA|nr:hypothetical protein DLAC_09033 [Tieghemostelium lacteum]|eukprot:KYQ90414.1 hypothetical protein DLAC_09033 [Tieghemostelium lacteum]
MWYQVNVEGSQPSFRVSHSVSILNRSESEVAGCSTVVIYGGKTPVTTITTAAANSNYTDMAFFSIGIGANEEYAKPQNQQSISKLNKILGAATNNGTSNNNHSSTSIQNNKCNTTSNTVTSSSSPSSFNSFSINLSNNNTTTTTTTTTTATTPRNKSYSRLPVYSGQNIFHWENCQQSEGDLPGDRTAQSLVALNMGQHKGKVLLFGGYSSTLSHSSASSPKLNGASSSLSNKENNLSNDIFLLDYESLYWLKCKAIGNSPQPRHSAYLCQISPDTILLFGGINDQNQILTDIHLLHLSNSNSLKWHQPSVHGQYSSVQEIFKQKTSTQISYKTIYCSGYLWLFVSNHEIYKFEVSSHKWTQVVYYGTLPKGFDDNTLLCTYNHLVILLVGNELHFFDTLKLEWTGLDVDGDLPMKRKNHSLSIIGTLLLVVGGQHELPLSTVCAKDIEIIDLKTFLIKSNKH